MREHLEGIARQLAITTGGDFERSIRFVEAVARISPDLMPTGVHPFGAHISAGPIAFSDLARRLDEATEEAEIETIIDAISRIIENQLATEEILETLRRFVVDAKTQNAAALAAKALALGGDRALLAAEHRMLASPSLSRVRIAARLLGYGRFAPAVPDLLSLLHPLRPSIAGEVIWALGEIGDPSALVVLHLLIDRGVMVLEAVEAAGKIGSETSVRSVLVILEHGAARERAEAARAIGLIATRAGASLDDARRALTQALAHAIDHDEDRTVRYYAIGASTQLGERIDPRRISRALDIPIAEKELDPMAAFFAKRPH